MVELSRISRTFTGLGLLALAIFAIWADYRSDVAFYTALYGAEEAARRLHWIWASGAVGAVVFFAGLWAAGRRAEQKEGADHE